MYLEKDFANCWTDMVLLSSGAFIGPEMELGYFISNNKSRYGFRLFYILFICFLRHLPKKGAQNHFWAPKTLWGNWAAQYKKKMPNSTTLSWSELINGHFYQLLC